ncbi:MAG: hypothetical protein ABIJ84_04155 [bacterium]
MDELKPENLENNKGGEEGLNQYVEKQQSPEEILFQLENAAESQTKVELTVRSLDGKSSKKGWVLPLAFAGNVLWVTIESGEVMPISLLRIEKVEQKKTEPPAEEISPENK